MTAQQIIDRARSLLKDTVPKFRWPNEGLIHYVNDAFNIVAQWRSDLFLTAGGTMDWPTDLTAVGDTTKLDTTHIQGLADIVASRALAEDADDKANAAESKLFLDRAERFFKE